MERSDESKISLEFLPVPEHIKTLLMDLELLSRIKDKKISIKRKEFVEKSFYGTFKRFITREDRFKTLEGIDHIISNAIAAVTQYPDYKEIIMKYLQKAKVGMKNLFTIYDTDEGFKGKLTIIIELIPK